MSNRSKVVGIVLAAGSSTRMGRPKALLPCPPSADTFTARIVRTLRAAGVTEIAVVGRESDGALRAHLASVDPAAVFVANPDADQGQLSSLLVGIAYAERRSAEGVAVTPVDLPLVRTATVVAALDAFRTSAAPIVRVTCQGKHGHPVIFGASVFADLRGADRSVGAKSVLMDYRDRVLNLEVGDPGVLHDIDIPEDYREMFGRLP